MSETENKTKDTKKEDEAKSSGGNLVIPVVLLLVSIIVIVATFHEDEYNELLAESESSATENQAAAEDTETEIATGQEQTLASTDETASPETPEKAAQTPPITADNSSEKTASIAVNKDAISESADAAEKSNSAITQASGNNQDADPVVLAQTPAQQSASGYKQQQAKYQEMMQNRRQAYEEEMQARRQQYDDAMKAREQQRAKFVAAKKAEMQQAKQRRIETSEKIRAIHQQIDELHNEIYLLMEGGRTAAKQAPPARRQMPEGM